ncbi:MAG: hypothetical protein LBE67_16365 [Kocuria palustris]|nr:hypothetical protein [Kocuria palustris]
MGAGGEALSSGPDEQVLGRTGPRRSRRIGGARSGRIEDQSRWRSSGPL